MVKAQETVTETAGIKLLNLTPVKHMAIHLKDIPRKNKKGVSQHTTHREN